MIVHGVKQTLAQGTQPQLMAWQMKRNGTCPQNVFKIYARGRELGESLKTNDEILLYTLQYGKWVSETNSSSNWLGQRTCPGSHRPPASSKYDTCYDAVFELWKQ